MPRSKTQEIVIGRIEKEKDRAIIYPKADASVTREIGNAHLQTSEQTFDGFHVIASLKEAKKLKAGDIIKYKSAGANFGWFVSKKKIKS